MAAFAGTKPRSSGNLRFCARFFAAETTKGRKSCLKTPNAHTNRCRPRPWAVHRAQTHPETRQPPRVGIGKSSVRGGYGLRPAKPSECHPRGACSLASVAHSRQWEPPTAVRPRVNRRENPPTLMGVCGVITHQSQFHKQRQFYQRVLKAAETQRLHGAVPLKSRRNPVETVSFADG